MPKKMLLVLVCMWLLLMPVTALAKETEEMSTLEQVLETCTFSDEQKEQIRAEAKELEEKLFFDDESLTEISLDADGRFWFTFLIDLKSQGRMMEWNMTLLDVEGGVGFLVVEGDKRNEVIWMDDGRLLIDGKEVTATRGNAEEMGLEEIDHRLYRNGVPVETKELVLEGEEESREEEQESWFGAPLYGFVGSQWQTQPVYASFLVGPYLYFFMDIGLAMQFGR